MTINPNSHPFDTGPWTDPADSMDADDTARVHRRPVPIHADHCPKENGCSTCMCGGVNTYVAELEADNKRLREESLSYRIRIENDAMRIAGREKEISDLNAFIIAGHDGEVEALRVAVERLADKWERVGVSVDIQRFSIDAVEDACAAELRALLRPPATETESAG